MDFETANCKSDKDSSLKLSLFILRVKIGWEKTFFQLIFWSDIILGSKKGLAFSIHIEVCHAPVEPRKLWWGEQVLIKQVFSKWKFFDQLSSQSWENYDCEDETTTFHKMLL